ncbi:MAG: hypothetical protein AAB562_00620 [Patescibacteria group bacterium]
MARQNAEFAIDQGPSKLDLMLSLFDTDMGARTVRFRLVREIGGEDQPGFWYDIQIISVRRRHPSAKIWDIEGITETQGGKKRVSIYYLSDTREGRMRIEEELRTHGVMETPSDARKARTLMIVIQKMIARYRNSHSGNPDEEIFRLFEKAKVVHWAEDHSSLTKAIENI